jgi:A/G-specific adenine glycosylase
LTLATWYEEHGRHELPWRHTRDRWAIHVSEVMLHQTQVARIAPVYDAFLDRFPTPTAMADAGPGAVIEAWGRLGYPRRALRLHACAAAIVDRHGGTVPSTLEDLLALPGVGTYTARAVAAFAFRQRHPVVDTNVRRVVARAVAGVADAGQVTTAADLVAVEALLPADPERAATASVAFMELGAVLCTPRAPRCTECPLWMICAWRRSGGVVPDGPSRRRQRYAGTDRQVRGLLLAVLRDATGPVPGQRLDLVWGDPIQRERALSGLVEDGLVRRVQADLYALP